MSFIHLRFKGKTTSPWHVGKRKYRDYLYTRDDYLWGRGVRGPVLRLLWRTFCSKSDARDGVAFYPNKDCPVCRMAEECPFWNLIGSDGEGEFKDKPRLIVTNLRFAENVVKDRVALATLDDKHLGVVEEKAPVFVEYLTSGACFEFEAIFMSDGVRFVDQFESALQTSLRFLGWGGFCNEGFGRGETEPVVRLKFDEFESRYIKPAADSIRGLVEENGNVTFSIYPLLILEKDGGDFYKSVFEEGFLEKFCNSVDERYWQFFGNNDVHAQNGVESLSGRARAVLIPAWSRKAGKPRPFVGIGNELTLHFKDGGRVLGVEEAKALAVLEYGVGRFKNQGFGSLQAKLASIMSP